MGGWKLVAIYSGEAANQFSGKVTEAQHSDPLIVGATLP
jgi:hypothetical protein